MKEFIQNVVEVTLVQNSRDFWDYAEIIVPAIISIISTIIAICALCNSNKIGKIQNDISKRQCNIELFEPRYKAFNILGFLLPVAKQLITEHNKTDNKIDEWDVLACSMQTYKFTTTPYDTDINFNTVNYFFTNLILEVGVLPCLFKNENVETVTAFLRVFDNLVSKICGDDTDEIHEEDMQELTNYINQIENEHILGKLEKYLYL